VCAAYAAYYKSTFSSVYTKRFEDFVQTVVAISRGGGSVQFEYDAVSNTCLPQESLVQYLSCLQCTLHANNREMKFPNQLFINGEFKDAADGKTYDTINPTDESVSYSLKHIHYNIVVSTGDLQGS